MQVNMHEAKTKLSALAEKAWEGEEIIIARAGKPYVKLEPYRPQKQKRRPGALKGRIWIADDFDETSEDIIKAFEGET